MAAKTIEFLSGTIYWAKIFDDPQPNFAKDAREWTFEFEPDDKGLGIIEKHGLSDRLKDKKDGRAPYLTLKRKEFTKDGKPNKHLQVYDADNNDWTEGTLIGNGSKADVKVTIRDFGVGKFKGIYPNAVRVTDLVEYEGSAFGAMDSEAPKKVAKTKQKATIAEDFGIEDDASIDLDDDVPF